MRTVTPSTACMYRMPHGVHATLVQYCAKHGVSISSVITSSVMELCDDTGIVRGPLISVPLTSDTVVSMQYRTPVTTRTILKQSAAVNKTSANATFLHCLCAKFHREGISVVEGE